jgi:TRAP-type C4-dicarboxylate transport system permease small subunit
MRKAIALLQKMQIAAGGTCLTIFLLTVVVQILARYARIAVTWTEDVSLYAFIWSVFMGAGAMVYERRHFAFTALSDALKSPVRKAILSVVISLAILTFSSLLLYYGIMLTKQFWNYTWVTIPSFKRGPVWLCLPISGCAAAVYTLQHIFDDLLLLYKKRKA